MEILKKIGIVVGVLAGASVFLNLMWFAFTWVDNKNDFQEVQLETNIDLKQLIKEEQKTIIDIKQLIKEGQKTSIDLKQLIKEVKRETAAINRRTDFLYKLHKIENPQKTTEINDNNQKTTEIEKENFYSDNP